MAKTIITDLLQIFRSSVLAVLPENLIRRSVKYSPTTELLTIEGENYNLKNKNVYLVGTGKAVQSMVIVIEELLNSKLKRGIVSIPEGSRIKKLPIKKVYYYEGAKNNLPDTNAENTTTKILDLITPLDKNDFLLVLISGGGSALLCSPKKSISLQEKVEVIKKLANSGADINELNIVRKRISNVKGGKLALKAQPAQVVSLILSDIVGDPLDLIASGPTYIDNDDASKAIDIMEKYKLLDNIPDSVKEVLKEPKAVHHFPQDNIKNYIIGSNKTSIRAAVLEAEKLEYLPIALSNSVTGNVKTISKEYSKLASLFCKFLKGNINKDTLKSQIELLNIPEVQINSENINITENSNICLILGGEITVKVSGKGNGGRNQQLALEFSNDINNMKNEFEGFDIYLLSAGTDGIDGPTDAAGAVGYLDLIADAKKANIDPNISIENNDSYNFFTEFRNGDLHIITGHTNTNVMDIHLLIIKRKLQ